MERAWPVAIVLLAVSCGGGGNTASEQAKREAAFDVAFATAVAANLRALAAHALAQALKAGHTAASEGPSDGR